MILLNTKTVSSTKDLVLLHFDPFHKAYRWDYFKNIVWLLGALIFFLNLKKKCILHIADYSGILPSSATAPAPVEAEIALYPADPASHPATHPSGTEDLTQQQFNTTSRMLQEY